MTACTSAVDRRLIAAFIGTALVTFSVALHVSFPNMGGSGLRLPFNAAVAMGMALMTALALWPATRGCIRISGFQRGLWLMVALLWLPLAWSWDATAVSTLPRLIGLTTGALLLLGLEQLAFERRHWVALLFAIYLGTLLEATLAWFQYTLLEPGNWMGFDPAYGRPWGIFQQSNVLASFLVTGLAISAWLMGEASRRWLRVTALLAPLSMPAMLLVLVSRIGWLASLVVIVLSIAHLLGRERRAAYAWTLALLTGCAIALALWLATDDLARSSETLGNTGARIQVYMHALRMILEAPLSGWGYGDFQYAFIHSFADWRSAHPDNGSAISGSFDHPHNELLLWGVEGGLLPMLALAGMALWVAWRLWRHGPHGERLMLMALLAPLALHAMTEYPFYHSLTHWLVFVLLLGLLVSRSWPARERANRYTFGIRVGAWLGVPLVWLFMITHLYSLWQVSAYLQSGGREVQRLTRVINPLGIPETLDFMLMTQQLDAAAGLGMQDQVRDYLAWAERTAHHYPTPALYANRIEAWRILGDEAQAEAMLAKAEYLYPNDRVIAAAARRLNVSSNAPATFALEPSPGAASDADSDIESGTPTVLSGALMR